MTIAIPTSSESVRASAWRSSGVIAIATVVLCILSYLYVDRPLSTYLYAGLRDDRRLFDALTHIVDPFPPIAGAIALWAAFGVLRGVAIRPALGKLLRVSGGVCVAIVVNDRLKYAFGRTWPETWTLGNPSWIRDHVFGFAPFHGGTGWASFPSGHTTVATAIAAGLWVVFPRGRPIYASGAALVIIGLIGADYHWLSDIIAGAGLGAAIGLAAARIGAA
ncbi:MAG: phosphatase PAP2 family protein [Hyphomicrobiales bacterium]|nr:phosphatase PAP2 family protein [Hyphomicrobiales bacterium]